MTKSSALYKTLLSVIAIAAVVIEIVKYIFSVTFIVGAIALEIVLAAVSVFCLFQKQKSIKIAAIVLLVFAVITFIPNMIIGLNKPTVSAEQQYVIHAGGRAKGEKNYLNCEEQFEKYLAVGENLIEIDFMFTSDRYVVCTHRFEHMPFDKKSRPTLAQFTAQAVIGKYTAMTFESLIDILKDYPSAKIVFDCKEEDTVDILSVMSQTAADKNFDIFDRFIIQVYSIENYNEIKTAFPEFKEFWYTNYKSTYVFSKMIKLFEDKRDVTTFVICKESWCSYAMCLYKTGKNIAVHTENSAANSKFYFKRGVTYVYADYV